MITLILTGGLLGLTLLNLTYPWDWKPPKDMTDSEKQQYGIPKDNNSSTPVGRGDGSSGGSSGSNTPPPPTPIVTVLLAPRIKIPTSSSA